MKRFLYILIAVLTFAFGVVSAVYYQLQSEPMPAFDCTWSERPSDSTAYRSYNTRSRFGEDVYFYHDFTSPETTRYLFDSNMSGQGIIEQNSKLDKTGRKIGERAIRLYPGGTARIFWTDGNEFWFVQADSVSLARKVESQCFSR